VTAREILRRRIEEEVAEYNRTAPGIYAGLVQPPDAERELNGYRVKAGRTLDADGQFRAAASAFARNGLLMLAGDKQIEDLDEEIIVTPGLELSFVSWSRSSEGDVALDEERLARACRKLEEHALGIHGTGNWAARSTWREIGASAQSASRSSL
jgi:hypothetical protein